MGTLRLKKFANRSVVQGETTASHAFLTGGVTRECSGTEVRTVTVIKIARSSKHLLKSQDAKSPASSRAHRLLPQPAQGISL